MATLAGSTNRGFTLAEIAIVVVLVGLLSGLAGTSYVRYMDKSRTLRAIADIASISRAIDAARLMDKSPPPDALADADIDTPIDPWGTPYLYLRIEGVFKVAASPPPGSALPAVAAGTVRPPPTNPRKDRFLKPINTDYDLYSSGPDGISRESLEHSESRDDVVRAINGGYFGSAERF